jgi:outer membrane protein assembly factor BamE (lipoprotein component of BamABCDE complex)
MQLKNIVYPLGIAATLFLAGCGTPAINYAKHHPELSTEHRQIMMTGKIPDGSAVAGMTREQIQLIMGNDATQYTKVDGHDAWVYVKAKLNSEPLTMASTSDFGHHDNRNRDTADDNGNGAQQAPDSLPQTKTTIVFDGDVAIRAEVVKGGL